MLPIIEMFLPVHSQNAKLSADTTSVDLPDKFADPTNNAIQAGPPQSHALRQPQKV